MPALARTDHVERSGWQAGRLGRTLDIGDLHAGLAIQPSGFLKQRSGDVHAGDLAPEVRKQSREASCASAEIDYSRARPRDAPHHKAIE
jgi:hypothetical protein